MTWKKGLWCAYQKLPLFNWGLTNQGIVLKTTPMNSCGAGQELTKRAELMLGVSMKTYIRDVDTKKKRERRTGYMPTCLSERESRRRRSSVSRGVNAMLMEKENLWGLTQLGYVRSDTEYRCWLWKERSWCNMNWLRVRNIKWEDGTHVLRAKRRRQRKLTKWRISMIVCRSSTYKFVGVWEISRS